MSRSFGPCHIRNSAPLLSFHQLAIDLAHLARHPVDGELVYSIHCALPPGRAFFIVAEHVAQCMTEPLPHPVAGQARLPFRLQALPQFHPHLWPQ